MTTQRRHSCLPSIPEEHLLRLASSARRPSLPQPAQERWAQITDRASIIWSFTASDIKTGVLPIILFAMLSALAGNVVLADELSLAEILWRTPQVMFWVWLNLLVHTVSNQRSPESIAEDRINKPWRPIASGRISSDDSRRLLLVVVPITLLVGSWMGVAQETLWAWASSWYYSDLGAGDETWILRQIVNGIGYTVYFRAAARALAGSTPLQPSFWAWLVIIALMVATTIQVQDLKDEEGDRMRNRKTVPTALGSTAARASVFAGVLFWTIVCPLWWDVGFIGKLAPRLFGGLIAYRVARLHSQKADKKTFVIWGVWAVSLFALPLAKRFEL